MIQNEERSIPHFRNFFLSNISAGVCEVRTNAMCAGLRSGVVCVSASAGWNIGLTQHFCAFTLWNALRVLWKYSSARTCKDKWLSDVFYAQKLPQTLPLHGIQIYLRRRTMMRTFGSHILYALYITLLINLIDSNTLNLRLFHFTSPDVISGGGIYIVLK